MGFDKIYAEQYAEKIPDVLLGGLAGGLLALGVVFALLIFLAAYVYFSLSWMTIGKKLRYKRSWLAWIPVANISMFLQLGGFHWAWVFLILIPVFGWIALFVLLVVAKWRIFERRNHPGWFSLSLIIPYVGGILYLIAIGVVAWVDKPRTVKSKKKARAAPRKSKRKRR